MELDPNVVSAIFASCLFQEEEPKDPHVKAEGITLNVGFHPGRLEENKKQIEELLDELPDPFKADKGGGWSFLQACEDKHGRQWTGMHRVMEQLFLLGLGVGKVECQMPRDMWSVLPGGMPYYVIK